MSHSTENNRLFYIFRKHFNSLQNLITSTVVDTSSKLYSCGLITDDVLEEVVSAQDSNRIKAAKIMICVNSLVKMCPPKLMDFLKVLKGNPFFDDLTMEIISMFQRHFEGIQ